MYYSDSHEAIIDVTLTELQSGNSLSLHRLTDDSKQAYQRNVRIMYCSTNINQHGQLKSSTSCPCKVEIRKIKRYGYGWYVHSRNPHSEQCIRLKKITWTELGVRYLRSRIGTDPINYHDVEKIFNQDGIVTHADGLSKEDKHTKRQFLSRIAAQFNELYTSASSAGYGEVESTLRNFCEVNRNSTYKVDTEAAQGGQRFKRAFLLCGQMVRVAVHSKLRFFAADAGNYLTNYRFTYQSYLSIYLPYRNC